MLQMTTILTNLTKTDLEKGKSRHQNLLRSLKGFPRTQVRVVAVVIPGRYSQIKTIQIAV